MFKENKQMVGIVPKNNTWMSQIKNIHRVWKKGATIFLVMTLPNACQF